MASVATFWPQTLVDIAQVVGALGTLGAIITALYLARAGSKSRVIAKCSMQRYDGTLCIVVRIMNHGPFPVYLTMWAGENRKTKRWLGSSLEVNGQPLQVNPGGHFELRLGDEDLIASLPRDDVIEFTRLWFQDSLENRFEAKGFLKAVKQLMHEPSET